ncbi:MAG: hypothetical protein H6506_03270 [Calditrichaeota bacterium]|nr:hypothetical protein [Calditrichota bacterium]MCB9366273.1 hypothetical protein [Calditrichota bacterium]MCB9391657.1 hypothetical protein [Calditrichota bacterium]
MLRPFLILLATLFCVSFASAKDRDGFGLGPYLGEPTGLNMQFFWDKSSAVDINAAWSWNEWTLLSADFQMYDYFMDMPMEWKWFYGGGVYMSLANDGNEDNTVGVRVPLGMKYHIRPTIMDVWLEVAPALELAPATRGRFQGGIGLTFWLW